MLRAVVKGINIMLNLCCTAISLTRGQRRCKIQVDAASDTFVRLDTLGDSISGRDKSP